MDHEPSQPTDPADYYFYERQEPSPTLAMFTYATMGQGILLTIIGLGMGSHPSSAAFGFVIAGFGALLIFTQYTSSYRKHLASLVIASFQLALVCFICFLLILIGGVIMILPLVVSLTTIVLNIDWSISLSAEQPYAPEDESANQISLREILGGILILAMILGPASFFYR